MGDTVGMTIITDVRPVDFNDKAATAEAIDDFAKNFAYADIEHALEISPNGNMYSLTGTALDVDSLLIGKEALKGSISIHNHVVEPGKDKGDSFSLKDLKFASEHELGKQYLVSGTRFDAFELAEYCPIEVLEAIWSEARYAMWEKHLENFTEVAFEYQDILREFGNYLKGFEYYEYI